MLILLGDEPIEWFLRYFDSRFRRLKAQLFGVTGEDLANQPDLAEKLSQACAVLKQELLDPISVSAVTGQLKRRVVLD